MRDGARWLNMPNASNAVKRVFLLMVFAVSVCLLSACSLNSGRDFSTDTWALVIENGSRNLYDFHDMFGQDLLDSMEATGSLESSWRRLHDFANTHNRTYELVSSDRYPHGVISAEYTVCVYDHTHRLSEPDGDPTVYHLFFVVHTPKEEDPAKRGVWSVSMVDDDTYHEEGFSFAARPDKDGQKRGTSPCGVFVGEDARTLASAIETPKRTDEYDPEVIGPGYNTDGPVTVMEDSGERPQKYSEEMAEKIEACLDGRDADGLERLFSKTVLDVDPETDEQIGELVQVFSGSTSPVDIDEVDANTGTGQTSMSYLHDPDWDNHVQTGFGTYYVGFRAVVTCGDERYQLQVDCCTDYERNANRLGVIWIALYPETPGGELPYGREPVAQAGTDMVTIGLERRPMG